MSALRSDARHGRAVRRVVVALAAVAVLAVGGVLVYKRWATIQNMMENERENADALAAVATAPVPAQSTASPGAGWPQWRGPNRDGVAPAGPLRTDWKANPPAKVWSAPCGGGYSSLAVGGGKVYTQDRQGDSERVLCLDAETGKEQWAFAYPVDYGRFRLGYAGGPRATPAVHDGRLYAVGATGTFVCIDVTGPHPEELWRHDLLAEFNADLPGWGVAGSPLVEGDLVVVQPGGDDGSVAAFDRVTGERRWAVGDSPNGYSSPVAATLGGVRHIVAVTGDSVLGIRPSDGQLLWSHPWVTEHRGNIATPVILGDHVFVSSNYGKGCALLAVSAAGDGAKVTEVYFRKNRVMLNHHSTSVAWGDHLYGYDNDTLSCVAWRTGQAVPDWEGQTDEGRVIGKGNLILADKHLIGLTESGTLFLAEADPKEFVFLGQVAGLLNGRENWSLPVLADGRIYLRDAEKVVCLEVLL